MEGLVVGAELFGKGRRHRLRVAPYTVSTILHLAPCRVSTSPPRITSVPALRAAPHSNWGR
eukprot:997129-Rhodomonas_salina.1